MLFKIGHIMRRAIVVLIVLALAIPTTPFGLADKIDKLSDGKTEDTVDFAAAGTNPTLGISVPFDAVVSGATLSIGTGPHTSGQTDYPLKPELDVGGDGDIDWAFQGKGYGTMGHQYQLSNGNVSMNASFFREESNTSTSILLPKNATVLSASLDVNGSVGYNPWTEKEITRLNTAEEIGHSSAGLGDINGDGFDDVGVIGRGKFLIYLGELGNFSDTPDMVLSVGFGVSKVWRIGDVNGDGKADMLLGNEIHFGGDTVNQTADVTITGYDKGNNFACSASYAGDINGDGIDDIIVGEAGDGMGYKGAAYIYYGGQNMDGTPDKIYDNPTGLNGQGFGDSVTYAGDLNNDTYDDLAISAMWGGPSNEGMTYIYYGGATWDNTSDLTLLGDTDGGSWPKFGNWISGGGDLNLDGYDDLVVAAFNDDKTGTDAGKLYVFYGGNPMNTDEDLEMFGSAAYSVLGRQVYISPDLNGDGVCDILASSPAGGFNGPQDIIVYYGGNAMDNISDWKASGKDPNNYSFGWSVAPTYDMLGLGTSSIVVGAPQQWNMRYGKIFFYNLFDMTAPEHQLRIGGQKVWNATGLFNDHITTADLNVELNTALAGATASADAYGNRMADLVLNLTAIKGVLNITNITIEYSYSAKTPNFAQDINAFLTGQAGPGNITVPLNITVSSPGKVTVKDINITITPNTPPVAVIDSIAPDPVRVTKNVTFQGHGTDTDGTITGYRWSSDKMGLLSLVQNPVLKNLTVGKHNISFEVMDDRGRWSAPAHEELVVLKPNVVPHVSILKPTNGLEIGGIYNVTGTAQDVDPDPLSVWISIDQGAWTKAVGNTSWYYLWDTKQVADGTHTISARAWDTYENSTIVNVTPTVNNTQVGDNLIDFELTAPTGTFAKAGTVVTYDFAIKNTGNLADTYSLSAKTDHTWSVSLSTSILALDPGKSSTVKARMTVPTTATKGVEVLRLNVTSTQNNTLSKTAEVSTNIMVEDIVAGLQVTAPGPKTGTPGSKIDLVFKVKNIGTITDDFEVTASTYHGWAVEIPDKVLKNTAVNGTVNVTVSVTVPSNAVGPIQEGVELNASSKFDPSKTASGLSFIQVGKLSVKVTAPANQTVKKEGVLSYEFTVTNTGDFDAVFTIAASSSSGWTVQVDLAEVTVVKGATSKVTVTVTVPKGVKSGTNDVVTMVVTSKVSPDVKAEGKVTTTVKGKTNISQPFSMMFIVLLIVVIGAVVAIAAAALHFRKKGGKAADTEPSKGDGEKAGGSPTGHEAEGPPEAAPEVPKDGSKE